MPAGWTVPALFLPFQDHVYAPAAFPSDADRTILPAELRIVIATVSG